MPQILPKCGYCKIRIRFKSEVGSRKPFRCVACAKRSKGHGGMVKDVRPIDRSPVTIEWANSETTFWDITDAILKELFSRYHGNKSRLARDMNISIRAIRNHSQKWELKDK